MCMGCMGQADFLATSGILGAASLRVGARMLLRSPRRPGASAKVTDAEARAFVASLHPDARGARTGDLDPVPPAATPPARQHGGGSEAAAPAEWQHRTPVPTP